MRGRIVESVQAGDAWRRDIAIRIGLLIDVMNDPQTNFDASQAAFNCACGLATAYMILQEARFPYSWGIGLVYWLRNA